MKYTFLGSSGLNVSQLCLGTMNYGGKGFFKVMGSLDQQAADEQIKLAIGAGINFIDTANIYSEGLSETITGQAIRNLGLHRDDLVITTKVSGSTGNGPNQRGAGRKHIMQEVEGSLKRLQTDYIDLYQVHGYDAATPQEETLRTLDDLVRSGKVRYIGASNYMGWHLMKALDISQMQQLEKFISLQALYSLVTRELEREIVPLLTAEKVGLMVWSPLAQGLLSGKYYRDGQSDEQGRLKQFDGIPLNRDKAFDVVDTLRVIAAEKGISVAQLSLAWLLHQPVVSTVVIAANKLSQLQENLQAVDIVLSVDELQRIEAVSGLTPEYPVWLLDRHKR